MCIDLYAASEEGMGLAFLQPLCTTTGGSLCLYPSLEEAALPQVILTSPASSYVIVMTGSGISAGYVSHQSFLARLALFLPHVCICHIAALQQ